MEKLIKQIVPNPLITSTVEIRFESEIKSNETLGVFFKAFGIEFPILKDKSIPPELKESNEELKYLPDYSLSNEIYSISFSNKIIAFENVGEYTLWGNYFEMIEKNLKIIFDLNIIKTITRIGLRYSSIFENIIDSQSALNFKTPINYKNYKQLNPVFKTTFINNDIKLRLQVIYNAKLKRKDIEKKGLYIDIDAAQSDNLPSEIDSKICGIINLLHTEEKLLFQYVINKDFLDSLEVTYN